MKVRSMKVKFESRDKLKLHGTLTSPSKKVRGIMLLVHGITSDREEWGIFERLAQVVAADGIACLRFDYRGHGESALDSSKISLAGILTDILSAWDELERRVEPANTAMRYIIGSSFGGGLAYAAAGRIGRIKRAFLLAPVFDYLVDIENCAPRWASDLKRKDHFSYNDLRLGRAIVNEAFYFDPLAGPAIPTTIFHGTADTDVSIELSQAIATRQSKVQLIPVEGAGHVLNVPDDLDLEAKESWAIIASMIEQVRKRID